MILCPESQILMFKLALGVKSEGGEGGADVYGGLLDDLGVVSPFQNRDVDSSFRMSQSG